MTRLKTVVLPDPLGPIRAVLVTSATVKEQWSSATPPPKRLVTPSTASSAASSDHLPGPRPRGRGLLADLAGRGPPPPRPLSHRRQDSPWEEQHDQPEHRRIADQVQVVLPEAVGEVLLGRDQHRGAERGAPQGPAAAEEDHQHGADRDQRVDGELRVDEGDV